MRLRTAPGAAILGCMTAGCSVGPNFTPPTEPTAAGYQDLDRMPGDLSAKFSPLSNPDPNWWQGFGDPVLSTLEHQAIAGNLNLQQAVLRVVASRQNEVVAGASGLPTLDGTGSYTYQQLGAKGILQSKGVYSQLDTLSDPSSPLNQLGSNVGPKVAQLGNTLLSGISQPVSLYQYGLSSSWQLDLFGKVRRSVEQAAASTQAQVEATNDSLVTLEGQVAQAYIQLRAAQAMVASQQDSIASAQETLNLTRRQAAQGISSQIDVDQAATQLGTFQAQLPGFESQVQQSINQLSILVGQPPGTLDAMLAPPAAMPSVPDVIGVGVPASLARRRPDIREAEAQLHSAVANVGVATASFYPDISLKGSAGLRAIDASYLTNWASLFYSVGPSVTLPIFEGGKLTATLRVARAQEAAAALAYRAAVLNALGEVENGLVSYRTDRQARDRTAEAVKSGTEALYLARNSFQHGLTSFLQVLDSERSLVQSRQQLIQSNMKLLNDIVTIYNALGGGWQQTEAVSNAPEIDQSTPFTPAIVDRAAAGTHR